MNEHDPGLWMGLARLLGRFFRWLFVEHSKVAFAVICGFIVALWSSLKDGKSLKDSAFGGIICVMITLPLMWGISNSGEYINFLLCVPIFVGFIGADQLRDAVRAGWKKARSIINEQYLKGRK
jgi:multisubunit Na+/H+ antiporter MnhE subunit